MRDYLRNMDENKLFNFYVGNAGNKVDETLRMSQVATEKLAMVFTVSTILLIRYFRFKNLSVNIK